MICDDEFGDDLLYAPFVEAWFESLVWVVLDEFDTRLLYALLEGLANVVESLGKVYVSGFES